MLEKILNRFGYFKVKEDEFMHMLIGNPIGTSIDKELDAAFFESLATVDYARDYLKATIGKDMLRFYAAKSEKEQDLIRGGAQRTIYFLSKIK